MMATMRDRPVAEPSGGSRSGGEARWYILASDTPRNHLNSKRSHPRIVSLVTRPSSLPGPLKPIARAPLCGHVACPSAGFLATVRAG